MSSGGPAASNSMFRGGVLVINKIDVEVVIECLELVNGLFRPYGKLNGNV